MSINNLQIAIGDSGFFHKLKLVLMYDIEKRELACIEEDGTKTKIATMGVAALNTPYHTTKMQQLGIYDDFISYMDSQHEYDKEQKALESAKQEAYQLALAENSELAYEDWLSTYAELMPVHQEPVPSERLMEFYNEYK